ncbi:MULTISPECIES: hypothetical protein [Kitasatospora]|uniref:Uncharacterized protein n=1 Tax=Kitasatospora setae (strain ATCC 33774 / DSM 43861 / JCM 3304 / KCC A-0304 / NBRC 14216 / KM-6054) TaxID=452652 RepID=E4N722_KITSK|nr:MULTISPECIES: hypothetical protein [Kitasatospora]BAJ27003.1 hypothetical protein KSE_11690 [Kitasatospora setae KM-6054]
MPEPRQAAFADWLETVRHDPDTGSCLTPLSESGRRWLANVFDAHGEVPPAYLLDLLFERRGALARTALDLLRDAAERDLGIAPDLRVRADAHSDYEPSGEVEVHGEQIRAVGLPEALAAVAGAVQSFLAEAHRVVWPVCPEHRTGVHPALTAGTAVWHCTTGAHELPLP